MSVVLSLKSEEPEFHSFTSEEHAKEWLLRWMADQPGSYDNERVWEDVKKDKIVVFEDGTELTYTSARVSCHVPVRDSGKTYFEAMQFYPSLDADEEVLKRFSTLQEAVNFLLDNISYLMEEYVDHDLTNGLRAILKQTDFEGKWKGGNFDYTKGGTAYSVFQASDGSKFIPVCEYIDGTTRFIYV